ncbi:unnamed protein product, partial [Phaeothamnion confervicola]
ALQSAVAAEANAVHAAAAAQADTASAEAVAAASAVASAAATDAADIAHGLPLTFCSVSVSGQSISAPPGQRMFRHASGTLGAEYGGGGGSVADVYSQNAFPLRLGTAPATKSAHKIGQSMPFVTRLVQADCFTATEPHEGRTSAMAAAAAGQNNGHKLPACWPAAWRSHAPKLA